MRRFLPRPYWKSLWVIFLVCLYAWDMHQIRRRARFWDWRR